MTDCGCPTEHQVIETLGECEDGDVGFYVSVRDRGRSGLLLGPFETHDEALAKVALGRELAYKADCRSSFYSFGTAKVTSKELRPGVLNGLAQTVTGVTIEA